jgi:hypothetical protein
MLNTYSHAGHRPRRARRIPARPCPCPPGPCARSLAGSPRLLACRILAPAHFQVRVPSRLQVPTPARLQGPRARSHAGSPRTRTRTHARRPHAPSLAGSPRTHAPSLAGYARTHARTLVGSPCMHAASPRSHAPHPMHAFMHLLDVCISYAFMEEG